MSVSIIPSPAARCKRPYESDDVDLGYEGTHLDQRQHKRVRLPRSSPSAAGRCGLPFNTPDSAAFASALAYLLSAFPGMDEKVVQDVLVECGNSIDAAIKRLTDLKLSTDDATVAAATAAASVADEGHQGHGTPGVRTPVPESQPQASSSAPNEPQTAEQWVDFFVSQMLAAKDMGDARVRAANALSHFERFTKQHSKDEADARLAEAVKENAIFKRAVQIQDARLKSASEEITQLRTMVAHYQERCSKLEMNNYSLAMHLQQATNAGGLGSHPHNPDVC